MILQTLIAVLALSNYPPVQACSGVLVEADMVLTEARCAKDFHGGWVAFPDKSMRKVDSVSQTASHQLALFTFQGKTAKGFVQAKIAEDDHLRANDSVVLVHPDGSLKSLKIARLEQDAFTFGETTSATLVFKDDLLVGINDGQGRYLRVSAFYPWLQLKIGGD